MSEQSEVPNQVVERPDSKLEQQGNQVESAVKFTEYLTSRYPQVDTMRKITIEVDDEVHVELPELPEALQVEPQLNYYITGSLATTLLSQAETIDLCEETANSSIIVSKSVVNPQGTRTALAEFARPIGDIDYVPTEHYRVLQKVVQDSYGKVSTVEYQRERAKYLWKGGGGPKFGEIPAEAIAAVKRDVGRGDDSGIMCDPVETYDTKKFARINLEGQDYYVARPDTIVGYKVLHMLQSYNQKPEKFNADFGKLHQAMTSLYSEDELVDITYQILEAYEARVAKVSSAFNKPHIPTLPTMVSSLLARQDLSQEARRFVGKVLEYDKNHSQVLAISAQSQPST